MKLTIARDINGNKRLAVKVGDAKAFSIQTNGVLPVAYSATQGELDSKYLTYDSVVRELRAYVKNYGTQLQRTLLAGAK